MDNKEFYDELYALKKLVRTGWKLTLPAEQLRLESDAEHIFSCVMLALKIINDEKLVLNQEKVIKILLYHEIGEIEVGDFTIRDKITKEEKYRLEQSAVQKFAKKYDMPEVIELWEEFEAEKTPEAKFCKMIDKLDTVIQAKEFSDDIGEKEPFTEFFKTSASKIKGYEHKIFQYTQTRQKEKTNSQQSTQKNDEKTK